MGMMLVLSAGEPGRGPAGGSKLKYHFCSSQKSKGGTLAQPGKKRSREVRVIVSVPQEGCNTVPQPNTSFSLISWFWRLKV
jgi:hypothetical protein